MSRTFPNFVALIPSNTPVIFSCESITITFTIQPGRPPAGHQVSFPKLTNMMNINSSITRMLSGSFGYAFLFLFSVAASELSAQVPFAVYLEAECAEVGDNFVTAEADSASNGSYVVVQEGLVSVTQAPDDVPANRVTFRVNVQEADQFHVWGRVRGSSPNNDSYWIRVNGGTWTEWNRRLGATEGWIWRELNNSPFTAEAGVMVIDFAYREANTQLDKIFVTSINNLTPTGMDQPAINCDEQTDCELYPEACADQAWIEGECGQIGDEWRYVKRDTVSNGGYIVSSQNTYLTAPASTDLPSVVSFTTDSIGAGEYYLYFLMNARADDNNSFWVKVDEGEWFDFSFNLDGTILLTEGFEWKMVNEAGDSTSFDLSNGNHTIYVGTRETGTYLDKVFLGKQDTVPTGYGSFALNCLENRVVPVRPSLDLSSELKVFPNPTTDQLNFSLTSDNLGSLEAAVYDFSGRRLEVQRYEKGTRTFQDQVDVTRLPRGVYQLVLTTSNGVISRNFVKQ